MLTPPGDILFAYSQYQLNRSDICPYVVLDFEQWVKELLHHFRPAWLFVDDLIARPSGLAEAFLLAARGRDEYIIGQDHVKCIGSGLSIAD